MTTATRSASARARRGGAKARLDREAIVAAGLTLAAQPGVGSVSVRDLGAQLGADPTAIYRHFRGKDDLMRSLLDEVIGMSLQRVDAEPDDWRGRLTQLAVATLELFATYPAIGVEATVLTTGGPHELDVIEFMLDALSRAVVKPGVEVSGIAVACPRPWDVIEADARRTATSSCVCVCIRVA